MAFSISKNFVALCEGPADQIFLSKLFEKRKITEFDVPIHSTLGKFFGSGSLGNMLNALSGDASGYSRLKGVLIVADSGDEPKKAFNKVCRSIAKNGPFIAPQRFVRPPGPNQTTQQPPGHPKISIMLVPIGRLGALETVCIEAIVQKKPWLSGCVDTYLSCGENNALDWGAEKRDKARLQCMIASSFKKDPNKGLAHLFSVKPPMIRLQSKVFTPIVKQILKFRDEASR
jgi:hypothetical protein